jgi:acyl-CoA synthetase (AMP-forming)/AMP-acid ligase II
MAGYENNPGANAEAFSDGWLRTGDQGMLDADGYLSITGRLKEIINRGGEKISPREVDEVLLDHPAVAQCVTFAVPHPTLGEDVAAAVVLREGATAEGPELRQFAAARLADFKVPRQILILPELPKGATGKVQRIGLAKRLGLGPVEG